MRMPLKLYFVLSFTLILSSCVQRRAFVVEKQQEIKPVVVSKPHSPKPKIAAVKPAPAPKPKVTVAAPAPLRKKHHRHIVLDAGHGGKDKGTFSEKFDYE